MLYAACLCHFIFKRSTRLLEAINCLSPLRQPPPPPSELKPSTALQLKPFVTQDYHLVSNRAHTSAAALVLVSLTFLCGFTKKKKKRTRKRQPDARTLLCSCVGTQACFLGGLACVLGLRWECFCFVKLIHTPGPCSAGWQHHLPGLKDGKRHRNGVVMKLIPCWQPLSIVLKGVAWVLWKGRSVVVDENI